MQVSTPLRMGHVAIAEWADAVTFAREAERLGVLRVWSAEAWNQDAMSPLGYLAATTSTIELGTGIAQAGTRTPALLAMTAMTLAQMSGGRFVLGLGTSGPQVIEGWHGLRFDRPLQRLREIVEIIRTVSRGERLVHHGVIYDIPLPDGEGKALRTAMAPRHIPIFLATLGPKSLELTGEVADGWAGTTVIPESAELFLGPLRTGAERAGRRLTDLQLQASVVVEITDDVPGAIARRKPDLAFMLGAMGSRAHNFYNQSYRRAGFDEAAETVQSLWLAGRRDEAIAAVPDELVLKASLVGDEAMVTERLRRFRDVGIDVLNLNAVGGDVDARLEMLGRAIDLVRSVTAETAA